MTHGELNQKTQAIVDELWSNPDVAVGPPEPRRYNGNKLAFDILACPVQPIYDPEELNDFMQGMVGALPSCLDYFSEHLEGGDRPVDRRLVLGRLCFGETLSVRLFPDAGHLIDAVNGHNTQDIPMSQLGRSLTLL
jgi:hypothetical protein